MFEKENILVCICPCVSVSLSVPEIGSGLQPFFSLMFCVILFTFFFSLFLRAIMLCCHTIHAQYRQNNCSGEHLLLHVIIGYDVWKLLQLQHPLSNQAGVYPGVPAEVTFSLFGNVFFFFKVNVVSIVVLQITLSIINVSVFCRFQRCFFSINPEKGTKVEKSSTSRLHVNPRVLTLIQDLSDHEWRDI